MDQDVALQRFAFRISAVLRFSVSAFQHSVFRHLASRSFTVCASALWGVLQLHFGAPNAFCSSACCVLEKQRFGVVARCISVFAFWARCACRSFVRALAFA
eukprot:5513688-Alexandrium_andersonii.AAC.1